MIENKIILSNGVEMPHIGLGTYPMIGQQLTNAVVSAYKEGYRLFDTADNYYNEKDLGESLSTLYSTLGAKREDIFLVTKVSDELYRPGTIGGGANKGIYFWKNSPIMQQFNAVHNVVTKRFEDSLRFLKTDYLDLYLMHWPYPDFFADIWYEMEQLYKQGKVRAIGICNCHPRHFDKLKQNCEIMPMVNQVETSPINTKVPIVNYCNEHNIAMMVYSPLMSLRRKEMIGYQQLLSILSEKYSVSTSQIILRFAIQRGLIPIPKSSNINRLRSNMSVFDFCLSENDMQQLYDMNVDYQYLPESKSCPGF